MSFLGLLGNKGDYTTLKILRELREELSFTEEEHNLLKMQPLMGGKIRIDEDAVPPKEFEFDKGSIREVFLEEAKTQLRDKEKAKTLELDYLDLYEVLVVKETEPLKLVKEEVVKEQPEPAIIEPGVKFVYRDLAVQWPSSDPQAENIPAFEEYLTGLKGEGWGIEKVEIYPRRPIGDMKNEYVIPVLFILTK